MANTNIRLGYQSLGNRIMTIHSVNGDGVQTTVTAKELGMSRIECAWLQDSGDTADLTLTTWKGSSIELSAAIGSGTIQLLFAIGS
jgi:hypothetical protein